MKGIELTPQTLVLIIATILIIYFAIRTTMGLGETAEGVGCSVWDQIIRTIPIVRSFLGEC